MNTAVPSQLRPLFAIAPVVQALLAACSLIMSLWAHAPWLCTGGVALVGLSMLAARRFGTPAKADLWPILFGWCGMGGVLIGGALAKNYNLDLYHATIAWQVAIAIALASRKATTETAKRRWKILGVSWAFLGTLLWLAVAYSDDLPGAFHVGLVLNVALLLACRVWFRLSPLGIQTVNTLTLLLVALPIADLFVRPSYRPTQYLEPSKKYFSYTAAHKDPATFARWYRCFWSQWDRMASGVFMDDLARAVPVRLRPGGQGMLFDSLISINSRGFRGKEFAAEKGRAYRIVAMGESSTYGCTINPGERPWPELLEELIQQRLQPDRPVEVINAGVPANELRHGLYRLPREILPLQPDMIISYHGYNGFGSLRDSLPSSFGELPPARQHRPLKLLETCEYRWRVFFYKRRAHAQLTRTPPGLTDPMKSRYAGDYRHFIQAVQTNGIRLVLGNFSLAVNRHSHPDVVTFYRSGFPSVYWQIRANEVHSSILAEFARQDPRICLVDTHPGLDGEHEKFIDLVHLTQEGRKQLAENFFAGIKDVLKRELSPVK